MPSSKTLTKSVHSPAIARTWDSWKRKRTTKNAQLTTTKGRPCNGHAATCCHAQSGRVLLWHAQRAGARGTSPKTQQSQQKEFEKSIGHSESTQCLWRVLATCSSLVFWITLTPCLIWWVGSLLLIDRARQHCSCSSRQPCHLPTHELHENQSQERAVSHRQAPMPDVS
jgi:hypothetical protein